MPKIELTVSADELARIDTAATAAGLSRASFVRSAALQSADSRVRIQNQVNKIAELKLDGYAEFAPMVRRILSSESVAKNMSSELIGTMQCARDAMDAEIINEAVSRMQDL